MGCQDKSTREIDEMETEMMTDTVRQPIDYLALGDSYTIGEDVLASARYPVQLSDRLKMDGFSMRQTKIIAQTGWRTDNLIQSIINQSLRDTFELVSLLIGVNNQFQNRPISTYRQEFSQLLNRSVDLAGGRPNRVFVFSIPDYGFTPFGNNNQPSISMEIDSFNAANRELTKAAGISWFDITPISRRGLDEPNLIAGDGLHPSGEMYAEWIETYYAEIKAKLK